MKIENLKVTINKEEVFKQIDCHWGSDLYEEFSEEYDEIVEQMLTLCNPVCLIEYSDLKDQALIECEKKNYGAVLVLYSIGGGISEFSTRNFKQGDYVKGMLSDAMADSALYSMEQEIEHQLRTLCEQMNLGISKRLEAPHDVSIELQKYVFEKTRAKELCDFAISTGHMINPVKSNVVVFLLTDDKNKFEIKHDCRKCRNYACKHRDVPDLNLRAQIEGTNVFLTIKDGESVLDSLVKYEKSFSAICGGEGKCGKCKIKVLEGELSVTEFDKLYLTNEEIERGIRLSCKAYPIEPIAFEVYFEKENKFKIITEYTSDANEFRSSEVVSLGIAIDIGTTTIALQLIDIENKNVIKTFTTINHQRKYGADVISRIKACVEGKKEVLQQSLISDLLVGMDELIVEEYRKNIKEVVISGNTTMIHLLMGYDCKSLGEYPFVPENIELIKTSFEEVFQSTYLSAIVKIIPGISAFVGGDIVSGMYACDIASSERYCLFIDLGTNGEIGLGNSEKIFVTSTAAGPAFEGGNIIHGVGSIPGAIANVSVVNGEVQVTTIDDKEPVGLCGTGVIETVAELVKEKKVDETGTLDDEWFDDGFLVAKTAEGEDIVFTQRDVREIQLAKAAIRGGIETLFLRYGISKEQISKVYIAGGFGYKLDCQKAIEIGMIPKEFSDRIEAIGNSSLRGAVKCLLDERGETKLQYIKNISKEINLSADKDFNQLYVEYMCF